MADEAPPEFVLHRYFMHANRMRTSYYELLGTEGPRPLDDPMGTDQFAFMSLWYGCLYALIEGWVELDLHHPAIDALLESPNVDLLRRYRNGTFHFQRELWSRKVVDFIAEGAASAVWARDLNAAFGQFFLEWFDTQRRLGPAAG